MRCLTALALVGFLVTISLPAQAPPAWQTASTLPGVDFTGLTAAQKASALKLMRDTGCTCGCDMKVAQCRVEDPPCTSSKGISAIILKGFKEGKTRDEVARLVASSAVGRPRSPQQILEDPVQIPTGGSPSSGPETARIVLVEFSDFECPYCAQAAAEIRHIAAAYPKDIRLVYKQFPLSMHPHAAMAAAASLAAFEQGKFWEMHDKMFANFRQLSRENLMTWAQQMGLDMDRFKSGLESQKNKAIVQKDLQDGEFAGVSGTPTLYVNGRHFNGTITLAVLKPILEQELKKAHPASRL